MTHPHHSSAPSEQRAYAAPALEVLGSIAGHTAAPSRNWSPVVTGHLSITQSMVDPS